VIYLKLLFLSLLFLVVLSGFVSSQAVEVNFAKDSFYGGETVQAEVFVDGVESNLRSNMLNLFQNGSSVSFSPHLIKLNSSYYYLYFDLGEELYGDYDLVFEDVIFSENESTYQSDFSFSFNVQGTNTSIFSINPGVVKANDLQFNNIFYVYLFNEGSEEMDVALSSEHSFIDLSTGSVHLNSGSSGFFTIYLSDLLVSGESGMKYVNLLSGSFGYDLPVWLGVEGGVIEVEEEGVYFVESSEFFDVTVEEGEVLSGGYVRFENGLDYATDVQFTLNGNLDEVISLESETLEDVEPGETVSLGLDVIGSEAGFYEGYIVLYAGPAYEDTFLIKVHVLDVEGEIVLNETAGDNVSDGDEVVDEEVPDEENAFKFGTWFWIVLFVLVIGLLVYLRYRKKKVKKDHPFFQK